MGTRTQCEVHPGAGAGLPVNSLVKQPVPSGCQHLEMHGQETQHFRPPSCPSVCGLCAFGSGRCWLGDWVALLSLRWASRTMLDFPTCQPFHAPLSSSMPRLHSPLRLWLVGAKGKAEDALPLKHLLWGCHSLRLFWPQQCGTAASVWPTVEEMTPVSHFSYHYCLFLTEAAVG